MEFDISDRHDNRTVVTPALAIGFPASASEAGFGNPHIFPFHHPNGEATHRKKRGLLRPWRQVVRHPPLRRIRLHDVAKTSEPLAQIVFLLARILALQQQVRRTSDHSLVPESDGYGLRQMLVQYWMNEPRFQVHNSLQKNKGYSMTGLLDAIVAPLASFPT